MAIRARRGAILTAILLCGIALSVVLVTRDGNTAQTGLAFPLTAIYRVDVIHPSGDKAYSEYHQIDVQSDTDWTDVVLGYSDGIACRQGGRGFSTPNVVVEDREGCMPISQTGTVITREDMAFTYGAMERSRLPPVHGDLTVGDAVDLSSVELFMPETRHVDNEDDAPTPTLAFVFPVSKLEQNGQLVTGQANYEVDERRSGQTRRIMLIDGRYRLVSTHDAATGLPLEAILSLPGVALTYEMQVMDVRMR